VTTLTVDQAFRRALASYGAGDFDAAEQLARAVLGFEPGHPAGCLLALLLVQRGEPDVAEQLMERVAAQPAFSITLDYPVSTTARHGAAPNRQLHEILQRDAARYAQTLAGFRDFLPWFSRIPSAAADEATPHWSNIWLPPVDAAALYVQIVRSRPARYVEIGSGNSTKFVRRAIQDHGLETEIVSIDPAPRAAVDALCDVGIRKPFEETDLSVFATLAAGDVVFVDNSHRCFMNSDATVFFTEVLPALAPGVVVGIHDIFLPYDYPQEWAGRYYSEQYLLACYLLGRTPLLRVLLPAQFLLRAAETLEIASQLCAALPGGPQAAGSSFWLEMLAANAGG
jgi:predicted O-methyltransferase YrrM